MIKYTKENGLYIEYESIDSMIPNVNERSIDVNGNVIGYQFPPSHIQIQNAINRMLGDGFFDTWNCAKMGAAANSIIFKTNEGDFETSKLVFFKQLKDSGTYHDNVMNDSNRSHQLGTINRWLGDGSLIHNGGWASCTYLHGDDVNKASEAIFKTACGKDFGNIATTETYLMFSYPSPDTAKKHGNNLSYYIRKSPAQFLKLNVPSLKNVIHFITGIACTVAGALTANPALLVKGSLVLSASTVEYIASNKIVHAGVIDEAKLSNFVADIACIKAGAAVTITNGTKAELLQGSEQFFQTA